MTASGGVPDSSATGSVESSIEALAARVCALPPRCGPCVVVAVDGPSGAGKTTLAAALADRLEALLGSPAGPMPDSIGGLGVVHLDELYPGWDGLDAGVPRLVDGVLAPLATGRPAGYRRWDWERAVDGPAVDVPPARVLVVDGVGSGARACGPYLSLLIWVDGPEPRRRERAIARDGPGYAPHWERWAAQERAHFAREGTAGRADIRWAAAAGRASVERMTTDTSSRPATDPTSRPTTAPTSHPAQVLGSTVLPATAAGGLAFRRIDADSAELTGWLENIALVFQDSKPVTGEGVELRRPVYRGQRLSGAFDGDLSVGSFRSWDTGLTVPGGTVTADAVSSVTVRPTHRRRGILTTLMHADLADAAARGVPVAILIASEAVIYGRYGYGLATHTATWQLDSPRAVMRPEVPVTGRVDVVKEADARVVAPQIHAAARGPGEIDRFEHWWDIGFGVKVFPGETRGVHQAVLHTADDGTPTGYLVYHVEEKWEERETLTTLHVDDLQAATPQAYAALWRYLTEVDLVRTVKATERRLDEPLPWLLTDQRAARQTSRGDFQWNRLLDPAAALSARRYERAGAATFSVVDPAGWAAGTFTLEVDPDGAGRCARTASAPVDVTLPVDVLSSVWLGGGNLTAAAWAGRCREERSGGVARLAGLLATATAPWTATWF
jgi:predicted acetyltransferase